MCPYSPSCHVSTSFTLLQQGGGCIAGGKPGLPSRGLLIPSLETAAPASATPSQTYRSCRILNHCGSLPPANALLVHSTAQWVMLCAVESFSQAVAGGFNAHTSGLLPPVGQSRHTPCRAHSATAGHDRLRASLPPAPSWELCPELSELIGWLRAWNGCLSPS